MKISGLAIFLSMEFLGKKVSMKFEKLGLFFPMCTVLPSIESHNYSNIRRFTFIEH
jgi:hypothetical protein